MLFRSGGIIPKATSLADQLKTLESVIGAYAVFGRFDIVAFLEAKDTKTLFKAVSDATRLEGIMSSETLIEVTANGESLDYGKGPPFSN
jgi:uncharacterized protein with GYD domain